METSEQNIPTTEDINRVVQSAVEANEELVADATNLIYRQITAAMKNAVDNLNVDVDTAIDILKGANVPKRFWKELVEVEVEVEVEVTGQVTYTETLTVRVPRNFTEDTLIDAVGDVLDPDETLADNLDGVDIMDADWDIVGNNYGR